MSIEFNDLYKLRRFLSIGTEQSAYEFGEQILKKENAPTLLKLIEDGKGREVVREIVKCYKEGRSVRRKPLLFALAVCARARDSDAKRDAYQVMSELCSLPTDLFTFIAYAQTLNNPTKGWGKLQRKTISSWYNSKDPKQLAENATRYKSKSGWSHKDVLRLTHTKAANNEIALVLKYIVKGLKVARQEFDQDGTGSDKVKELLEYLEAVDNLKHSSDDQQVARLMEQYQLTYEHLPSIHLNSKEVWITLLHRLPFTMLLQNISKIASLGLLEPVCDTTTELVKRLKNIEETLTSKIHPYSVLVALRTYEQGKGLRRKWTRNSNIVDALNFTLNTSIQNVPNTRKRYLIIVKIGENLFRYAVRGSPVISPILATALMSLVIAQTEEHYQLLLMLPNGLVNIKLTAQMQLSEICDEIARVLMAINLNMPFVSMDLSLPMTWAIANQIPVDVFLLFHDCQHCKSCLNPVDSFQVYRKQMNLPDAKFINCAMCSSRMQFAAPDDVGMLDIAGFDESAPHVIRNFIEGNL